MLERKVYRNPPLIEVFAEFTFNEDLQWDSLRLGEFYREIGGQAFFPTKKDPQRRSVGGQRNSRPGRSGHALWQFLSPKSDRIVQVGQHRLVLNQLPPYYNWETFRVDAEQIVGAYLKFWPTDLVKSSSLHYIDMIVIPGDVVSLSDYFNFYPIFPPALLKRPARNLAMACQFEGDAEGETLIVSFQHDVEQTGQVVFRLQWDYHASRTYRAGVAEMIGWLDNAHKRTSEAFRESLTPQCEALFQPE